MKPLLIARVVFAALIFCAGFVTAWRVQENNVTSLKLEVANATITSQRATRAATERRISEVGAAQAKAQVRLSVIAADASDNRSELDRLRRTADEAMRAASGSLDACNQHAATQAVVFAQCASRLVEVGRDADGHASDVQALMDSWPKNQDKQ